MQIAQFKMTGNHENAAPMAAYMKNQFVFLGLKTPQRKAQAKPLAAASKKLPTKEVLAWIRQLYSRPQREYQYVAIELAEKNVRRLSLAQMRELRAVLLQKPWWDTIDAWRKVYGLYIAFSPDQKRQIYHLFAGQQDFWLRRIAITLQLMEKTSTDTQMLTEAIEANLADDEFFIQKAIGWALRQYSRTDKKWVKAFIESHALSRLAVREGGKYL